MVLALSPLMSPKFLSSPGGVWTLNELDPTKGLSQKNVKSPAGEGVIGDASYGPCREPVGSTALVLHWVT